MEKLKADILAFYGDAKTPNYSKILPQFEKGFPAGLFDKLNDRYWIKNTTDVNCDAAFFINLLSEDEEFLLVYSFVTDGFHIIRFNKSDRFDSEPDYSGASSLSQGDELVQFCLKFFPSNVQYLDRQDLKQAVEFNWDGQGFAPVPAYKILFLQEGTLPYFE